MACTCVVLPKATAALRESDRSETAMHWRHWNPLTTTSSPNGWSVLPKDTPKWNGCYRIISCHHHHCHTFILFAFMRCCWAITQLFEGAIFIHFLNIYHALLKDTGDWIRQMSWFVCTLGWAQTNELAADVKFLFWHFALRGGKDIRVEAQFVQECQNYNNLL